MSDNYTLAHALSKNSIPELKKIADRFTAGEETINPNSGKPQLIEDLVPLIPERERVRIIDEAFNTPKTRYNAHLGKINRDLPTEDQLVISCENYNGSHGFDAEREDFKTNTKESLSIIKYEQDEVVFHYTYTVRKPDYDFDTMESRPVVYSRKIRIVINPIKKQVAVYTGDRDLFNSALSALTIACNSPITPLDANKTGISNLTRGSFSFHTVKVLDFIYHGLSKISTIGAITQINLETPAKSQKPQKVRVQGDYLLSDKSICEYLFIHSRELVGMKLDLIFTIEGENYSIGTEIGIRDGKVKIGLKKDKHPLERLQQAFEQLEDNAHLYLSRIGLIDEEKTETILEQIRQTALS